MRWILAIVGIVAVVAALVFLGRARGSGGSPGEGAEAPAPVERPVGEAGTGEKSAARNLSPDERRALAELRAELRRAVPAAYRTDGQRLEEALAWVAANRPANGPYNELEAKILALMDGILDGEKRSALWTLNASEMELEMIRAIDADGDGRVSDEEVQRFAEEGPAAFNPMEHPYLRERLDVDHDGTVSPDEMSAVPGVLSEGALAGVFERGRAESWDTDLDGLLSDGEREAGEQAGRKQVAEMFGEALAPIMADDMTPERRAELVERMGEEMVRTLESQRDMLIGQAAAAPLMEAMRLDDMEQPDAAELMAEAPKAPDLTSFDIDGDGSMIEDEGAAQQTAIEEYQREMRHWAAEYTANQLRKQFEHATSRSDQDGDGRLTPREWDARLAELLAARDERLFLRSYDLDGSGLVDAKELSAYLDWYRAGSLRADFNYDGAIDARDLEGVAISFQQQSR